MAEETTTAPAAAGPKPKKSVALSGVPAGNTALCTVGRSGNDLNYRGYDILQIAEACEFEEVAFLLVHGKLPNAAELKGYKAKLKALRGLPAVVQEVLQSLPANSHPMDVLRTGASALGCALPEKDDHGTAGARDIADRLIANSRNATAASGRNSRSATRASASPPTASKVSSSRSRRRTPPRRAASAARASA